MGRTSKAIRASGAKLVLVEHDPKTFKIHQRRRPWTNPILGDILDIMLEHSDATAVYFDGMGTVQKLNIKKLQRAISQMVNLRIYWQTISARCM